MKNPFASLNAKSRQEFWLDLDEDDRIGILNLAQKDNKALLFLENIRMSDTIDPDDAWVTEGLEYCEKNGGLKTGASNIIDSLRQRREESREQVTETAGTAIEALHPLLGTVADILKQNNVDLGFNPEDIGDFLKNRIKGGLKDRLKRGN
jgi:hypothetical protein